MALNVHVRRTSKPPQTRVLTSSTQHCSLRCNASKRQPDIGLMTYYHWSTSCNLSFLHTTEFSQIVKTITSKERNKTKKWKRNSTFKLGGGGRERQTERQRDRERQRELRGWKEDERYRKKQVSWKYSTKRTPCLCPCLSLSLKSWEKRLAVEAKHFPIYPESIFPRGLGKCRSRYEMKGQKRPETSLSRLWWNAPPCLYCHPLQASRSLGQLLLWWSHGLAARYSNWRYWIEEHTRWFAHVCSLLTLHLMHRETGQLIQASFSCSSYGNKPANLSLVPGYFLCHYWTEVIYTLLMQTQLRWADHVTRMLNQWLP